VISTQTHNLSLSLTAGTWWTWIF